MSFFGSKKNVIDLTEGYNWKKGKEARNKSDVSQEKNTDSSGFVPLGFFANSDAVPKKDTFSEKSFDEGDPQDKRRKLAKRLVDMTDKIEDLSNQIYHLQQRLELLERKVIPENTSTDY